MGVIMHVWRGEMQSGRAVEGTPVRHVLFRHGHAMAATRYERAATTYLSNHFVGGVATYPRPRVVHVQNFVRRVRLRDD
jgi:hypothetical protein